MKRSSGPRKTANLSEPIHQHLNMYALAASAAGVGILTFAQPAEAKIVYTKANVTIAKFGVHSYNLDLNNDGITDVTIQYFEGPTHCFSGNGRVRSINETPASNNAIEGVPPAALSSGAVIGRGQVFNRFKHYMLLERDGTRACYSHRGNWYNVRDRYLGVKFKIQGKSHFGWARLTVYGNLRLSRAYLTGYAYETIPGKSIIAGKTHGPVDEWDREDFGPGASLTNPIPDTPQPASLGMLALGAQGVPLWRRKESVDESD